MTGRTRHVTKNGISWTEVVPWTPPPVDGPIVPLVQDTPPLAISLYADPDRDPDRRRRRVNEKLEKLGLRPRDGW